MLSPSPTLVRRSDCPKHMVFGPCGGVRADGGCEVHGRPCPFVGDRAPGWPEDRIAAPGEDEPAVRPLVVVDVRPAEPTLACARDLARRHAGWTDRILLGDHHERVDLPNLVLATVAMEVGCTPWVTFSCRDRNRVALEGELAACAELGVPAVHCVTGDARAEHVRPGSMPVFDLDSLQLTALARSMGLVVSVAESPEVAPADVRPGRTVDKWRAGAS